jgi:RTX calcium-binding nonapeptide repeat (4 copies)
VTLQSVLNFVNIIPNAAGSQFTSQIISALSFIYQNSPTMQSALDVRVASGIPLNIEYEPGQMRTIEVEGGGLNFDVIQIDPVFSDSFLSINQFGFVEPRGFPFMFLHELSHALFSEPDPSLEDLNSSGFDFLGNNVRLENLAAQEMGWADKRIGYFSAFGDHVDHQLSYTGGREVQYAFKNDAGFAIVDASNSMQKNQNGLLVGSDIGEALIGGSGGDFLWGLAGDDALSGGHGGDVLFGGASADQINGDEGDDLLFFDAADMSNGVVNGGAGRDVAFLVDDAPIAFNLTANEIETLVGGGGSDTITAGNASDTLMIAGGGGADVIDAGYGGGEGLRIFWGGDDAVADTFQFNYTGAEWGPAYQLGLMVATVSGLTAANFHLFTPAMLGLSAGFDWNSIDAIILNPSAGDQVVINGMTPETSTLTDEVIGVTGFDEDGNEVYDAVGMSYSYRTAIQGTTDFLGQSLLVQTPDYDSVSTAWFRRGENQYATILNGQEVSEEDLDDFLDAAGPSLRTWVVDVSHMGPPEAGDGVGQAWFHAADADGNYAPDEYDDWFVAGGKIDDSGLLASGAPSATMDPAQGIPPDWLLA